MNATTELMPAGVYYVGDLCYVMENEWDEACDLFFAGRTDHGCNEGKFTLADGREFISFNTAYGDGTYHNARSGAEIGVDAGLIGCIRLSDITGHLSAEMAKTIARCGELIEFDSPFYCSKGSIEDGCPIRFGDEAVFFTADNEEEEEEDFAYEDEE